MQSESNIRCLLVGLRDAIALPPEPGDDPTDALILNAAAQAVEWTLGENRSSELSAAFDAMAMAGAFADLRKKQKKSAPSPPPKRA